MIDYNPPRGILVYLIAVAAGLGVIWIYGVPLASFFTTGDMIFPIVKNIGWRAGDVVTSWSNEPRHSRTLAQLPGGLAHVPAKWTRFADKNMRHSIALEHVPIPKERNML
jgi:hypothetical protein